MKIVNIRSLIVLISSLVSAEPPTVSILGLTGLPDSSVMNAMTNRLQTEVIRTKKYRVLERAEIDEILREQGFSQTGCTSSECAIEVGQLLNVQNVLLGSITKIGSLYSVAIRVVNVQTGVISKQTTFDCEECSIETLYKDGIQQTVWKLLTVAPKDILSENTIQMNVPPQNMVAVGDLYVDKYEATQAQFKEVFGDYEIKNNCPNCPVRNITWDAADEFCRAVGKRLPTLSEWKTAARGGKADFFSALSWEEKLAHAWVVKNSHGRTHEVGTKEPNPYGLYDMVGNVSEWCSDTWKEANNSGMFVFGYSTHANYIGGNYDSRLRRLKSSDSELDDDETDNSPRDTGFRCVKDN